MIEKLKANEQKLTLEVETRKNREVTFLSVVGCSRNVQSLQLHFLLRLHHVLQFFYNLGLFL